MKRTVLITITALTLFATAALAQHITRGTGTGWGWASGPHHGMAVTQNTGTVRGGCPMNGAMMGPGGGMMTPVTTGQSAVQAGQLVHPAAGGTVTTDRTVSTNGQ